MSGCTGQGQVKENTALQVGSGVTENKVNAEYAEVDNRDPNIFNNHIDILRRKRAAKKKARKGKKGKKGKKTYAAHYVLKDNLLDTSKNCPRGTQSDDPVLDIFNVSPIYEKYENPFEMIRGCFRVKKKGLYLVYAQVTVKDCRGIQMLRLVQKRKETEIQELFCSHGEYNPGQNIYSNTCHVSALFDLDKGDCLYVENYLSEIHLNVSQGMAFFGAVMLR